jgi:hypothetical protein
MQTENNREAHLTKICASIYKIIPEPPQLNHVLKWYTSHERNRYSHFEVMFGEAFSLFMMVKRVFGLHGI